MKIINFFKKYRLYFSSVYNIFKSTSILILVIPLMFNLISYNYTEKFVTETTISINENVLKNSQTFIDTILNSTISSVLKLSSDKNMMQIAYLGYPSLPQSYDLSLFNSIWESYDINSVYIKQKYIYYPNADSIYTGSTVTLSRFHYMFAYNGETVMTEQIWKDSVLNKSASGLISVPSSDGTRVFFTYSTHDPVSNSILSNIIVELDFNRIATDTLGQNAGRFFMYVSDGTVIASGLSEDESAAIQELCTAQKSGKSYYVSNNNKEIFTTKSQISNWNYGYIANNEYVEKNMSLLRTIMFAACLLCTLVSLVIIGKKEKSAQEIAEILPDAKNTDDKNVYSQIKTSLANLIGENEDYTSRLSNQNNMLKEHILMNMLTGKKNAKFSYAEQLSLIGVNMEDTVFVTIVLCATDLSQIFHDESRNTSDNEKQELAQLIISNIMSETLAKYYKAELVSMGNFSVAIVNFSKEQSENFKSDITFVLETSLEIISKEFNFDVIAAISNPHVSLSCINDAYNESVLCMEYAISSKESISFYNEITINSKKTFPIDVEDDIIKCLNEKDYRQCKKVIENVIYRFQQNKDISSVIARSFAYELLTIFFRNAIPNTNDTLGMFMTEVEMNSIMSESTSVSEILLKTITIIERYLDKYDTSEDGENITEKSNFYLQIKNYIDEHYQDFELSAIELATIFKINSSYLSSQFKKEFNIGLLDYVTSVRIEAAKKLLLTTDEHNTEISRRVGYSNVRTFLRAFSKYEGITPKEYRRINNPSA